MRYHVLVPVSLLIAVLVGCRSTGDRIPVQFQQDREAFVLSVMSINRARMLSQPPVDASGQGYAMAPQLEAQIDSLIVLSIDASKLVSDSFLVSLHPELPSVYRGKMVAGAELWLEGIRLSRQQGGIAGVAEQGRGTELDSQWLAWLNAHVEISRLVIR